MSKVNTEKPAGKDQSNKMTNLKKTKKEKVLNTPLEKEKPKEETNETQKKVEEAKIPKEKPELKKFKKSKTSVNITNLSVSTKVSVSICKFILNKKVERAIKELEEVSKLKKAIPMKGEYAHKKGNIMSGKYPVRAAKEFIILLKSLQGNANHHDIENPVVIEAVANKGSTVYASGGRTRKRTNLRIVVSDKKLNKRNKK
ncbi:MAG: hypothetical protein NUV46_01405 [Nanoarchaeota archaeon]|nr:hypothetical protein [Nanoarchaeota archaeon]